MHLRLNVRREVLFLFLYIFLCNMALINEGATQGYSAVVLPILRKSNTSSISLNAMEILFFASTVSITPLIGSLVSLITMHYGRRCTMIACGVNFSLGWILIASSYNVTQLFIGRALTGISIGLAVPSIEIYLAEISIPAWREVATITPNIGVSVGILLVYVLGFVAQNNWRLIAAFFIIPSTALVLCNIFFLHESPMWLLLKDRKEEAKIALLGIRGLLQETVEFQEEFTKMVNYNALTNNLKTSENCQIDSLIMETEQKSFLTNVSSKLKSIKRIILLPEVWKPMMILNLYFFFQRFSGLYVIIYYCVDMISRINITVDPFLTTVIIGVIQVVSNIISACCSMRIGRRSISIVSGAGMSISLGVLAIYLQFFEDTGVAAIPLVCILSYVALGAYGFFSVPWSMIPELYPIKYVNFLGSFTTIIALLFDYTATQLYPIMVTHDRNATIYFYCIMSITATIFLMTVLPETLGKTKTQIEDVFRELQIDETLKKIEGTC